MYFINRCLRTLTVEIYTCFRVIPTNSFSKYNKQLSGFFFQEKYCSWSHFSTIEWWPRAFVTLVSSISLLFLLFGLLFLFPFILFGLMWFSVHLNIFFVLIDKHTDRNKLEKGHLKADPKAYKAQTKVEGIQKYQPSTSS